MLWRLLRLVVVECFASLHFTLNGLVTVLIPPRNVEGVVLTVAILSFANQSQLVTVLYKINVLIELKVLLFWDIAICASTRIWLQPRKRWIRLTPLTSVYAWRSETSIHNNDKTNNERTPECWACHPFSLTSPFPPPLSLSIPSHSPTGPLLTFPSSPQLNLRQHSSSPKGLQCCVRWCVWTPSPPCRLRPTEWTNEYRVLCFPHRKGRARKWTNELTALWSQVLLLVKDSAVILLVWCLGHDRDKNLHHYDSSHSDLNRNFNSKWLSIEYVCICAKKLSVLQYKKDFTYLKSHTHKSTGSIKILFQGYGVYVLWSCLRTDHKICARNP